MRSSTGHQSSEVMTPNLATCDHLRVSSMVSNSIYVDYFQNAHFDGFHLSERLFWNAGEVAVVEPAGSWASRRFFLYCEGLM